MKTTQWALVEVLPDRLLLSVETPSMYVVDHILTVVGTSQSDHVELTTIVAVVPAGHDSPASDARIVRVRIGALEEQFAAESLRGAQILAGAGDDVVDCSGIDVPVTIRGGAGNDQLTGGMAGDEIHGGAGDDTIRALAGDDTVYGGAGNDSLTLGAGNDLAFGGEGNDKLIGKRGNDTLYGGNGNDSLDGGQGNDSLQGNAGNDSLADTSGVDTLRGGDGDDYFYSGSATQSVFYGGKGDDTALFDPSSPADPLPHTVGIEHVIGAPVQLASA